MRDTCIPLLALAAALATTPAFAQDATTASGKHFAVVGSIAVDEPTGDATLAGQDANLDGEAVPTLGASWYINDNIALEAWGAADKIGQRVSTDAGKVASVESQPFAISGQYHFRQADSTWRPFVGLGYFQSNISGEETDGALAGQRLGVDTPNGPMATVGIDVNLSPTWFARADARYLHGGADAELNGVKAGDIDLNPVIVGVGVGARF